MIYFSLLLFFILVVTSHSIAWDRTAVVTLVMGDNTGYVAGAIALGQSLIEVKSQMQRVVLVTPDVSEHNRAAMRKLWIVKEVEPIYCNHKLPDTFDKDQYDLNGAQYQAGLKRWSSTCTKFAAWKLTAYDRVLFMDSDMVVVEPIDNVLYEYSNATFAAAPETFPPDNFNSGFMVLTPSEKTFKFLLKVNEDIGSAEGGDQGVFNNGLCPQWYTADSNDKKCGRIPWMYNVAAAYYDQYKTLRLMSGLPTPKAIHFVSDGKPWVVLAMDYMNSDSIAPETVQKLKSQAFSHLYWRMCFFKATGDAPPVTSVIGDFAQLMPPSHTNTKSSFVSKLIDSVEAENDKKKTKKVSNDNVNESRKKSVDTEEDEVNHRKVSNKKDKKSKDGKKKSKKNKSSKNRNKDL
jgi:lipopolysaccharide biosynthesis glycosyltransferase